MQFKRWFGWLSQFYLCIVTHGTEGRGGKILIHFPPRGVRNTALNFLHRASLILGIWHSCGNCFVFLLDSHWMRYLTVLQWPFLNGSMEFLWVYLQKKHNCSCVMTGLCHSDLEVFVEKLPSQGHPFSKHLQGHQA